MLQPRGDWLATDRGTGRSDVLELQGVVDTARYVEAELAPTDVDTVEIEAPRHGRRATRPRRGPRARRRCHPVRSAPRLDAFGQIEAVAEDVMTCRLYDDLAEMNADADQEALLLGEAALNRAMCSWMSMCAWTAATAEPNSRAPFGRTRQRRLRTLHRARRFQKRASPSRPRQEPRHSRSSNSAPPPRGRLTNV
jgi:hypothetical protein